MNNKKWKSLVALLFSFTLILGLTISANAETENTSGDGTSALLAVEQESLQKYDDTFLIKQSEAFENYTQLQEMLSATSVRSANALSVEHIRTMMGI